MKSGALREASLISLVYWICAHRGGPPQPSPLSGAGAGAAVLPVIWMPNDLRGLPAEKTDLGRRSAGVPPAIPRASPAPSVVEGTAALSKSCYTFAFAEEVAACAA